MALTPEEIAHRAFTPSADGYHQGEVRSFLNRIAAQLHALHAGMPEGRAELAEIIASINSREPRLMQLEQQLELVSTELVSTTHELRQAQTDAGVQLATAHKLATDQRNASAVFLDERDAAASIATDQLDATGALVAQQRSVIDRLGTDQRAATEQLVAARELAAEQRVTLDQLTAAAAQAADQLRAIEALTTQTRQSAAAVEQLVATTRTAAASEPARAAVATLVADPVPTARPEAAVAATHVRPAATMSAATDPIDGATLEAPRRPGPALNMFAADLDNQPLFSDSANDLLDGVLDDVMGNLSDEGR